MAWVWGVGCASLFVPVYLLLVTGWGRAQSERWRRRHGAPPPRSWCGSRSGGWAGWRLQKELQLPPPPPRTCPCKRKYNRHTTGQVLRFPWGNLKGNMKVVLWSCLHFGPANNLSYVHPLSLLMPVSTTVVHIINTCQSKKSPGISMSLLVSLTPVKCKGGAGSCQDIWERRGAERSHPPLFS